MVGLYFGRRWEIVYTICVVLFIFSGLWAYATVFANSMMVFVPFPGLSAGFKATSTNSSLATVSCRPLFRTYCYIFHFVLFNLARGRCCVHL